MTSSSIRISFACTTSFLMSNDARLVAVLALACALGLIFAAGSIADPAAQDEDGGAGLPADGADSPTPDDESSSPPVSTSNLAVCLPWLSHPAVLVGLIAGWLAVGAVLVKRSGPLVGSVGAMFLLFPGTIVVSALSRCGGEEPNSAGSSLSGNLTTNESGETGNATANGSTPVETTLDPAQLEWLLPFLLAIGFLLVVTVAAREWDEAETERPPSEPALEPSTVAIGREAGRAADRLEASADVDNEVYRAWAEMTAHVDLDGPETATPGEFAAAAVEAGMDRDHVEELTHLFEAVRYGSERPTADRESRAVAVLRRIQAAYGPEAADDGAIDSGTDAVDSGTDATDSGTSGGGVE